MGIRLDWEDGMIPGTAGMFVADVFAQRETLGLFKQDGVTPITMDDLVNMSLGETISDGHAEAISLLGTRLEWELTINPPLIFLFFFCPHSGDFLTKSPLLCGSSDSFLSSKLMQKASGGQVSNHFFAYATHLPFYSLKKRYKKDV